MENLQSFFKEHGRAAIWELDQLYKDNKLDYSFLNGRVYEVIISKKEPIIISYFKPVKMLGWFDYNRDYSIMTLYTYCLGKKYCSRFGLANIDDAEYSILNGKISVPDFLNFWLKFMRYDILDTTTKKEVENYGEKIIKLGAWNNTG